MAAAAFCALRSAALRERVHTAGRQVLLPPLPLVPISTSSPPSDHLPTQLPLSANAAVLRAAAVLSACFESLANDQQTFRVVFSSPKKDSESASAAAATTEASVSVAPETVEGRDDGSISPFTSAHLMAPAYQRLLQWVDSEVRWKNMQMTRTIYSDIEGKRIGV